MNLSEFLDIAAGKYPNKTAVICDNKQITYGSLKTRTDRLAASLFRLSITKGTKAGILSFNCIEYIEIIFALMKLGAVCVPLNHRLIAAEIKALVTHADVEMLFYGEEFEGKGLFEAAGIKHFITLGSSQKKDALSYESLFSEESSRSASVDIGEKDTSFIIYTAGTTGAPKGVVLTHGNQIWNTQNYTAAYGMTAEDTEFAPTALFHTSTLGRVFTYVFNAMTFILCRKFSPEESLKIIQQQKVTSITQAPTMYRMMMKALKKGARDTHSVRRAVSGAAPMQPAEKSALQELFPNADLYDLYGLTEAAPGVTILKSKDFFRKPESVGKPLRSVEVVIKDEKDRVVPAGQVGEVVCRGPNVMQGYYKAPEATAAVLKKGWLHTGDMGFMDDEGFLYLAGRKKDIIISGGVNIYPAEVEKVLMQHPAVDEAAIIGIPDETWGEKVTAAVVLKKNHPGLEKEIIDFCRDRLAGFKCPRGVFFTTELPRNAAQKVLKKKLQRDILGGEST